MPRIVDVAFGSSSALDKDAPSFLVTPYLDNVIGYSLLWANIPFSYYTIDAYNNQFEFQQYVAPDNVWKVFKITLKPGSYTADTIRAEIKRALSQVYGESPYQASQVVDPTKFEFMLMPEQARFMVYTNGTTSGTGSFRLTFPAALAKLLGFLADTTYESSTQSVWENGTLVGSFPAILASTSMTLLSSQRLNIHSNLSSLASSCRKPQGLDDVFAVIPVTGNYTSYIYYQHMMEMVPITRQPIDRVSFYLTLGEKRQFAQYVDNALVQTTYLAKSNLPLNGDGFLVCIRFYIDDGTE